MDYNTARAAGRLAGESDVKHAALGVAGITSDGSATDFFVLGFGSFDLEKPVPRRYVRLAQALAGLSDGFHDSGHLLSTFHCLGLGATSMLSIPAAAVSESVILTTDATSPIHDAVRDRVLYDLAADGERTGTRDIVELILNGGDWPFLSPFSQAFRDEFGHKPEQARQWWRDQDKPPVTDELLSTQSALTKALPLFCEADEDVRRLASTTRIAHNHWVLDQLCESFQDGPGRHDTAFEAFERWLAKPSSVTIRGLQSSFQIIRETQAGPLCVSRLM
jgi:hypothetical protein